MTKDHERNSKQLPWLPGLACLIVTILLTLWPGDDAWNADGHGDDAKLIHMAITANAQHRLVVSGLGGSFGYPYGPVPAQIYQLLALVSHDPVTLVQLHAVLFAGITSIGLLWLTAVLGVSPWFAPMTMVGPFFWFYGRLLWDNTFAIPIGTLMLAGYGSFLNRPNRRAFFVFVAGLMLLPFIHPMTLPLVAAVGFHALIRSWREFVRHWMGLVALLILLGVSCGPYAMRVAGQMGHSPGLMEPAPDHLSRPAAFAFPFFSGRVFCAYGFFDARGPETGWEQNRLVVGMRYLSLLAYGFIWIGLIVAIGQLRKKIALPVICLIALLLQSLLDGRLMISPYPHYYCGTWAAIVVMLWLGLDHLKKFKLRLPVGLVYAASLLIATSAFVLDIHHNHGGTVWYGPSMDKQLLQ